MHGTDEKLLLFGRMARNKLGLVVSGRGLNPVPVYLRSDQPENANAPPPRLLVESSAFSPFASTANADDGDARN